MLPASLHLDFTQDISSYFTGLKNVIDSLPLDQINLVIQAFVKAYENDRFIYIFGNGGSASTASHFATDFNKGICEHLSKKFRLVCLNDNVPTMLAISNDIHYDQIFKRQLENFLSPNDLVVGISGSGNSTNICEALKYANSIDADTIGLVGFDGGKIKHIAKSLIHIPINDMQQVEDMHLAINHMIMRCLMKHLAREPIPLKAVG